MMIRYIKLHEFISVCVLPGTYPSAISQYFIGITQPLFAMGNQHLGKGLHVGRSAEVCLCSHSHEISEPLFYKHNVIFVYFDLLMSNESLFLFFSLEIASTAIKKGKSTQLPEKV